MMEIGKAIIIAVVSGLIVAAAGYLLIVKENQMSIRAVEKEISQLREMGIKTQDSLNATKLFVAQAHPDRDASTLASIMKLKKLDINEITGLASSLRKVEVGPAPENEIKQAPADVRALIEKYELTGKDLKVYGKIAELPMRKHAM